MLSLIIVNSSFYYLGIKYLHVRLSIKIKEWDLIVPSLVFWVIREEVRPYVLQFITMVEWIFAEHWNIWEKQEVHVRINNL